MAAPGKPGDSICIKVSQAPAASSADAAAAPADAQAIVFDRHLLAAYSSCARGLPADATEWDVSQLLIGGQSVQRETVIAWLNAANKPIHGCEFVPQASSPVRSMSGLAQLLAFADAVGTSRGLLLAFDTDAATLQAQVQLTDAADAAVQLQMGAGHHFCAGKKGLESLRGFTPTGFGQYTVIAAVRKDDKPALKQQVAQQLEALLCLAYKLNLPVLSSSLGRVIQCNSCHPNALLDGKALQSIVSDSLLAAAGCGRATMLQRLFPVLSIVLRPLGAPSVASNSMVEFVADVTEDFMYYKKYQKVVVRTQHYLSSQFELRPEGQSSSHIVKVQHALLPWDRL